MCNSEKPVILEEVVILYQVMMAKLHNEGVPCTPLMGVGVSPISLSLSPFIVLLKSIGVTRHYPTTHDQAIADSPWREG